MGIELVKYSGLLAMIYDHIDYRVTSLPLADAIGSFAFPLFLIALVWSLRDSPVGKRLDVIRRLVKWGVVAQAMLVFTMDQWFGNVLFTFALGLYADILIFNRKGWQRWVWLAVVFVVSSVVEFAFIGVLLVPLGFAAARGRISWAWLAVGCLPLYAFNNGAPFAIVAVGLGLLLLYRGPDLPRIPRLFYSAYVLQWPLLWAARVL